MAAIEALHAEVRGYREEMTQERMAKATLVEMRRGAAERQARARQRNGHNGIAAETRELVYARDGRKCLACGTGERLSIDHVVPKVRGGDDDVTNLQTLCIPCNSKKNGGDFRVTLVTQRHVTPVVVKALDLDPEKQEQVPTASRNVTARNAMPAPTAEVWRAYSEAYERRHGVKPPDSAKSRTQLKQFLTRVPVGDAPAIAAFYLTHNDSLYVRAKHPIDLLLRDAPKLYTEWKTGRTSTATEARQKDQTQANMDGWLEHMSQEGRDALVGK